MCKEKLIVLFVLAFVATSVANNTNNETITNCLRSEDVAAEANDLNKCYLNSIFSKMENTTESGNCKNFDDFNQTYRSFYRKVSDKCFNVTNANLNKHQATILNMVKYITDNATELLSHVKSCKDIVKEISHCQKRNLTALTGADAAQIWLRRSALNLADALTCDNMELTKNCTIKIVKEKCDHTIVNLMEELYNKSMSYCKIPKSDQSPSSSAYLSPWSLKLFIVTALLFMCR